MNNWCIGCVWGTDTGGVTYCPFVAGSCVRLAGTIDNPDPDAVFKAKLYYRQFGNNDPRRNRLQEVANEQRIQRADES